ncbi:hypothetical protein STTU_1746 [Streptomyces sp. Tu6071]|nr:hypothetical protein STTU_1746 [Streptomyces sp. Tu6071]
MRAVDGARAVRGRRRRAPRHARGGGAPAGGTLGGVRARRAAGAAYVTSTAYAAYGRPPSAPRRRPRGAVSRREPHDVSRAPSPPAT